MPIVQRKDAYFLLAEFLFEKHFELLERELVVEVREFDAKGCVWRSIAVDHMDYRKKVRELKARILE